MKEKASFIQRFLQVANLPTDTKEQQSNKENLILMSTHFTFVGVVWGIIYFTNGLWLPSCIPFGYTIISAISISLLVLTKKFIFFRNTQLCLVLILPFLLHLSLGGFIPSSSVILWAIVSPMAALFFITAREAISWFTAFLALTIIAYLMDDELAHYYQWDITDTFIDTLFLLNIIGVSALVFLVQNYFASNERSLKKEVEEKNVLLGVQSNQLRELDKMKSNFFANLSHEFRTPLTLIQGILHKTEAPNQEDRSIMIRNADRLLQLINQLLDLAKLESGKMQLKKRTIDLNLMARKTAQLFGSAAEMKGIEFQLNDSSILEEKSTAILVELDAEQIQKVLFNLISNAIKFCPEGGKINMYIQDGAAFVQVIISNTGEHIPEEQLQQIFNRFYQVESDSTRGYEGTGIGLSLVYEIIELHGGQINVNSKNQVISFELSLPKGQLGVLEEVSLLDNVIAPIPQSVLEPLTNEGQKQLKILVVEDYPDLRNFITRILKDTYSVIEAANGEEGVQGALQEMPDLIISDIMMPKKDGNQLCMELKNHPATDHIPIILLTARAEKKDKIKGLEQGADDYLTKPFDASELLVRVKNLLQIRQKLQQKYQKEIWLKPKEVKVSSQQEKFLQQLKAVIEQELSNETLSVEDLAKHMALSRSQLHRKLKALTNQSTTEFLRIYRLERGADLLKQGLGNVSEIAMEVGFNSQTYFSSSFQKHFGCSPSEYVQNF